MARLEPTAVSRAKKPDLIPGYRLDSLLGRGGMGEVYKATQLSLNRTVAVKILSTELAKDKSFVARFEKEAAALATLSHPNVVDIVDKGHTDDTWYLVMEYIDGPSLREVMRSPLLDPGSALRMVVEICRGVDYAHTRGVIHRDLKPENILFDEQAGGIPKVTDFGLAGFLEGTNESRFNVTETHVAMGTASYMAPEQRVDARKADHRADIYSLGVILYELVTGELPIGNFDPPSQRKPGVDPKVDGIVARCLKQDPSERYGKTSELLAALEPLAPVTKTSVGKAPSAGARLVRSVKRGVMNVLRVAALLVVLAAAAVLTAAWARSDGPQTAQFPGAAAMVDLDSRNLVTMHGRIDKDGPKRKYTLGEGPDTIPLLVFGRAAKVEDGAIVSFPERGTPAGRVSPDVVDLDGDDLAFTARVRTDPEDGALSGLKRLVSGKPTQAKGSVLLLGGPGRYVSVSVSQYGQPLAVEWALGERRGVMLGTPSPDGGDATLELTIDSDGVFRALAGEGEDKRQIAEPLQLGADWRKQFGGALRGAFGCTEGVCRFDHVAYKVSSKPPPVVAEVKETPPPPAPVKPAVVRKEPVRTTPVKTTRPATTTKKTTKPKGRH